MMVKIICSFVCCAEEKEAERAPKRMHIKKCTSRITDYCDPAACDCPAATSRDIPAYTAPGDVTSYRTCYGRRPTEHAMEPGTVLTTRCVEQMDASVPCECFHSADCQNVDAINNVADSDRVSTTQLDLLLHDATVAPASVI